MEQTLYEFVHSKNPKKVCVAYSGGADSTALLIALSNVVDVGRILALHANHQLQVNSELWEKHCIEQCNQLGIEIEVERLVVPVKGNIEATARIKRYAFFSRFLDNGDFLLLGHHQQDQVETSLMRILQGRGLIQMSEQRPLGKGLLARPLLNFPREKLVDYLSQKNYSWAEDESNSDQSFDRNYVRSTILPLVADRWPNYAKAFQRVICYNRDKDLILNNYFNSCVDPVDLELLPIEKSGKIVWIRGYIESRGYYGITDRQIEAFVNKLGQSNTTVMNLKSAVLGLYKNQLFCESIIKSPNVEMKEIERSFSLDLGWAVLNLDEVDSFGDQCFLVEGKLSIRFGLAKAKIWLKELKKEKTVKKLLSERSIPPWRRLNYPLIYLDDCLVYLPGIAIDSRVANKSQKKLKIYRASLSDK